MLTNECLENICFRYYNKVGLGWHRLSFDLPLPSLALVLDRDHELVGLVDQVRRRGEHRVGLSLFEVLLERVGEALRILDELALPLLEGLLAGAARDVARDLVHRVQQLLYRARNFPENKR